MSAAPRCRLLVPGIGEALVPLPASLQALRSAARLHFGDRLPSEEFVITDTSKDLDSDADVQRLQDGATLVLTAADNRALAAPAKERISFQPHPKTLTMAGEFEYFAAQGRHPFVYALAEFVDNSLRATRRNAPRPRSITISLVLSGSNAATSRGLVCIQDNGVGMSKRELGEWAVMNLSMEERGAAPQEPAPVPRGAASAAGAGAGRFLTGDLSFFGVGSKNAGFFMGSSIKVVTKRADERYVHELRLAAADLEKRYLNREEVYAEEMVHRNAGDLSTLSAAEQPFSCTRDWVVAEGVAAEGGGTASSFTRIVISDLKPDVLQQMLDDERGVHICQELAHVYHYYLHGEQGNRAGSTAVLEGRLPNGEPLPDIVLQYQVDTRVVWQQRLAEVMDDMETRCLRAQQAEFAFTLQVPNKGTVCGVLYYFPFQNDQETVPVENPLTSTKPASSPFGGQPTQLGATQLPRHATQHPAAGRITQAPRATQLGAAGGAAAEDDEDDEALDAWQVAPIFEAFWSGRLIPGARIDTLPFVEAVRSKRSAQAKDTIPDEAFRRLRGTLFFGPAFRVTRNKLLFRDNIPEVLATAMPGDRQLEAKFKQWLQKCHATLDKSVRFEALVDSRTQAVVRNKLGEETTAFERITDGSRAVATGDVVRVNVKPQVVGRVLYFTIPQAVRDGGCYANGRVHVKLLPDELYGLSCEKHFSLRRLEAVLSDAEQREHLQKEMLRVPASLHIEPMRFSSGQHLEFTAGATLPETCASIVTSGGQRIVKTTFSNERFTVTQRLWRLPSPGEAKPEQGADEEGRGAGRRGRKGRKDRRARQDENADPAAPRAAGDVADGGSVLCGAELILETENRTPIKDSFEFVRISDGLQQSGTYVLEYVATPAAAGQQPLRSAVQLAVTPGPPCSFCLSGEGREAAALKQFVLGETLPPIKVSFSDRFGNLVAMQPTETQPSLSLAVLVAAPDGSLQPCQELQVVAQQAAVQDGLLITDLQLLGSDAVATGPGAPGLQLLAASDLHLSARQAQVPASQQALPAAEVALAFSLGSNPDLKPLELRLRLRAGAPQWLRLLPDHPWGAAGGEDGMAVVTLEHGSLLALFQVAAFDAWGNPTAPTADLDFTVVAESSATRPGLKEFKPSAGNGITSIEGLEGAFPTLAGDHADLTLSLKSCAASEHTQAAVEVAQPSSCLTLPLAVQPSVHPASIALLRDEQPLPTREQEGEDGPVTVTLLEGLPAGSSVTGLRMVLLDGSGRPAKQELSGKIMLSWKAGSKKATWGGLGSALKLPAVKAPESTNGPVQAWARFLAANPPLNLEAAVQLTAVPADPVRWTLGLVNQMTSQHSEEMGAVRNLEPFTLEIKTTDSFHNICTVHDLLPEISFDSSGPLHYNEKEWERGWGLLGAEQVYTMRLAVSGHPGQLKVTVRDSANLLEPDTLTLDLLPGPPAQLAVEGPPLECGTRVTIPQLRVRVCDEAGNPTTSESFEVSLCSSALAIDGSGCAASVAASGGNKIKLKNGVAVFKDVCVVAEEAGTYALRVQGASRKVAVRDAQLHLIMQPLNVVNALHVLLPETLASGSCLAGTCAELHVAVVTADRLPLPPDVAAASLVLNVMPPGGGKSDVVCYSLPAACNPGQPGGQPGGLRSDDGQYAFQLPELTAAGSYSCTAEYLEARPELAGLAKKGAALRSASVRFQVQPSDPVTAGLEAASLPEKLAVTNGSSNKQRLLLHNASVQLQDAFGNAAGGIGVQVRCRMRLACADTGSEVPKLHSSQGPGQQETDERGRAFLGDLSIVEGSGHAASGALECELVCEALGLYPSSMHELETDGDGWAVCWSCPVLFSDNAARFPLIERLQEQRGQLERRRGELLERASSARDAAAAALEKQQQAQQAVDKKEAALQGPAPNSLKSAKRQLAAARRELEQTAAEEHEDALEARYGGHKSVLAAAIDRLLQSGDAGLVGVVAQLATVDDKDLSAVLAATFRSQLVTVVVQNAPARQRAETLLAKQEFPMPDMLVCTMMLPSNAKAGNCPGFASAGERAHALQAAACRGSDSPLAMPLPHTAVISRTRAEGLALSASDWPRGCLGYAVNLMRPVHTGHRATVIASLFGGVLVFETLEDAVQYKEFVTLKLKGGTGMIVTLDGKRILPSGVVSGSSFVVSPVDNADIRFGSNGAVGQNSAAAQAAEQVTLLEELVELLRRREEANGAAAAAQDEAEQAEAECRGELDALESQIAELDAQLVLGDMASGDVGVGGQPGRKKRGKRQQAPEQRQQAPEHEEGAMPECAMQDAPPSTGKRKRRRRMAA